jgi:transcriptional regulator GlxA family with amidase domain
MRMAFLVFDQMTMLDLVGFMDGITRLKVLKAIDDLSWDICAMKEEITDDRGMTVKVNHVRPDLSGYDLLFVPGGFATRQLRHDADFISWLQTGQDVNYKVSVCTGALLLGAAGFLSDKRATTNRSAYELLVPYCKELVDARVVRDGNIFTGGGVSASIDLGLYVIEALTNAEITQKVQLSMDYPYYQVGSDGV